MLDEYDDGFICGYNKAIKDALERLKELKAHFEKVGTHEGADYISISIEELKMLKDIC